jgi:hypothetical protein
MCYEEEEQTKMTSFLRSKRNLFAIAAERKGTQVPIAINEIPSKEKIAALIRPCKHETEDGEDTQSVQSTRSNTSHHCRSVTPQHTNSPRTQSQNNNQSNPNHVTWNGFQ